MGRFVSQVVRTERRGLRVKEEGERKAMAKKTKQFQMRITTEEEREKIVLLLADCMRDIVFVNAEAQARETVRSLFNLDMATEDELVITYKINVSGGMIRTLLGKVRRKGVKIEEEKGTR